MSKETLKANLREIPDFPIPGILFYDVTTLFKNAECLQEMLDTLYEMYKDKGITKVVGIGSVLFSIRFFYNLCREFARLACHYESGS